MTVEPNVRCDRCGYRWHADTDGDELPAHCPRCYQDDIAPITGPPPIWRRLYRRTVDAYTATRQRFRAYRRSLVLWKENNVYLLNMGAFMLGLLIILAVLYIVVFRWA